MMNGKKIILGIFLCFFSLTLVKAEIICPQKLSPQEFNLRQREFIEQQADLTEVEANAFFKLFFNLQAKKRENNHQIWKLISKAREGLTEKEYADTLTQIYNLRLQNAKLDSDYFIKYQNIISNKKIFEIFRAEAKFQREIIRGMNRHHKGRKSIGRNRS